MPRLNELLNSAVGRVEPSFDAGDLRRRGADRRRRRRSARAAIAGVAVSLLGVGLVALVVGGGGAENSTLRVDTGAVARNVAARATIGLPAGWRQLPTVGTTAPQELLVVGTADRPPDEPIGGCSSPSVGASPSAFVSVYEYVTGAQLNSPDHQAVYDASGFISRPADFTTAAPAGPFCPGTVTTPPILTPATPTTIVTPTTILPAAQTNHLADYTFLDSGRFFVAHVFSTGDPDKTQFRAALSVLNSLNIAVPPEVTTTTTPGAATPTTLVPAKSQDAARQAILDAIRGAFGGGGPLTSDQAIAGGSPIGKASRPALQVSKKEFIGFIVPRIDWLTLETPTHATVNFDLLIDGRTITANTTGEAVLLDGRWQITAETFCTIAHRGNVTCPSP